MKCHSMCAMEILYQGCNSNETCAVLSLQAEARCSLLITDYDNAKNLNQMYFKVIHPSELPNVITPLDDGYIHGIYGTSAYRKGNRRKSYADAETICQSEAAHLLYIETQDEYDILKAYDQSQWKFIIKDDIWIGAQRYPSQPLVFQWPSGGEINSDWWMPNVLYYCIILFIIVT